MPEKNLISPKEKQRKRRQKDNSFINLQIFLSIFLLILKVSNEASQIKLKIYKTGDCQVINPGKVNTLSNVNINGVDAGQITSTYNLQQTDNTIILTFKEGLNDCESMFSDSTSIKEIHFLNFDTSLVTKMSWMFKACTQLISIDLSSLSFSLVQSIIFMFSGCTSLEQVTFGSKDSSKLIHMQNTFENCNKLKSIDISQLDFSVLSTLYGFCMGCTALETVNFGNNWNAPALENMGLMFQNCENLKSLDLSNANLPKLTNMELLCLNCKKLEEVKLGNIYTPLLDKTYATFQNCISLTSIDLSDLDTPKLKDMILMFAGCEKLEKVNFGSNTTPSLEKMRQLFQGCKVLTSVDLSHFIFTNVKDMEYVFDGCNNLQSINLGNINTQNLETMKGMFQNCQALINIDLSSSDFSKVTNMEAAFNGCSSLQNIKFGNHRTNSLQIMKTLFNGCSSLTTLDLSIFATSQVTDLSFVFNGCSSLPSLDVSGFVTSNVVSMSHLFSGCSLLDTIDISNWSTSNVKVMDAMFYNCINLENLILGEKDTSNVENMNALFQSCKKLSSIALSNWVTSKVNNMAVMFFECQGFKYLDLSNFQTPEVNTVENMFAWSNNLRYLNLYSFIIHDPKNKQSIFNGLKIDTIICINEEETRLYLLETERLPYAICSDTCKIETNIKIDFDNQQCLDSCEYSTNNKYDYKNRCLNTCPINTLMYNHLCIDNDCNEFAKYSIQCTEDGKPIGYFLDSNDGGATGVYKKCYELCETCNGEGNEANHNCIKCISGYRHLNDFDNDHNCYRNCPFYYYFDNSGVYHCTTSNECPIEYNLFIPEKRKCIDQCDKDNIYKYQYHDKCYNTTIIETTFIETTQIEETTNKIETTQIEETTNKIQTTNLEETTNKAETTQIEETTNKVETTHIEETTNKIQTTHIKETTNKIETINIEETTEAKQIESTPLNEITSSLEEHLYNCFDENSLINKCVINDNYTNTEKYNFIASKILSSYSSENFKSLVFEGDGNVLYQIAKLKNELDLFKNNRLPDDYNMSIVDLGQCEPKLKQEYGIAEEDSLIIIKKEISSSQSSERDIDYEIFEPYNKTKLNLSICEDDDINVYVPFTLSEENQNIANELKEKGNNMFDLNDPFYQDYCSTFKTLAKTDMLLTDRVDHIYNNLDAKCQDNCVFSNYVLDTNYINCSCNIYKQKTKEYKKVDKLNYNTALQSFYYVLKYSNYKILQCYKLVFVKTVISANKGSILILILFNLYLICFIMYIIRGVNPLQKNVYEILEKNGKAMIDISKNSLFFPPKKNKRASIRGKNHKGSIVSFQPKESEMKIKLDKEPKGLNSKVQIFKGRKSVNYAKDKQKNINRHSSTKETSRSKRSSIQPRRSSKIIYKNNLIKLKPSEEKQEEKKFDDFELNELSYEEAIKYDQRGWFKTYFSLIKREHRIIFTFFICNDYNLFAVKLSRFIFLIATDIAMNVFFFSDATMHKIFLDYGKYNFVQQIPQILYSSIVSQIIEVFLCFLSLTDKHIYQIKGLEIKTLDEKNKKIIQDVFNIIKKKLFFYFLFTFIFFLGYWYVVACFCAVYPNTQSIFLKDCLMSILLAFLYPFILYIFPSAFRKCALGCKNNSCLFKVSEVIPFF